MRLRPLKTRLLTRRLETTPPRAAAARGTTPPPPPRRRWWPYSAVLRLPATSSLARSRPPNATLDARFTQRREGAQWKAEAAGCGRRRGRAARRFGHSRKLTRFTRPNSVDSPRLRERMVIGTKTLWWRRHRSFQWVRSSGLTPRPRRPPFATSSPRMCFPCCQHRRCFYLRGGIVPCCTPRVSRRSSPRCFPPLATRVRPARGATSRLAVADMPLRSSTSPRCCCCGRD